eukprot:4364322-Pyramimonas_sp.AAC.1
MARIWHPVLAKARMSGQGPLQFKVGTAVELQKSGLAKRFTNYRSILLNNSIAKHRHAYLRRL